MRNFTLPGCYKLLWILFPFLLMYSSAWAQDEPREVTLAQISKIEKPKKTDEVFVNGEGGNYDIYLYRKDVPAGKIKYDLVIDRFYSPAMKFDGDGLLSNADDLISRGILPKEAIIRLAVFDVDHDATVDPDGDGVPDPEEDYLYINGKKVTNNGAEWRLRSGNQRWSDLSIKVPISYLKFPQSPGTNSDKPSALNQFAIDIDVRNVGWAIECDWISVEIKGLVNPVLMVHGCCLGSPAAWDDFIEFFNEDGVPTYNPQFNTSGRIGENADVLAVEINNAKTRFGVEKVHILAHSKGTLDSRDYLRRAHSVESVTQLIQLGAPNHGRTEGRGFLTGLADAKYDPGALQLRASWMATFNYQNGNINQPLYGRERRTKISSLAGGEDDFVSMQSATLPWNAQYQNNNVTTPININLEGQYLDLSHSGIREDHRVYRQVISQFEPGVRVLSSGSSNANKTYPIQVQDKQVQDEQEADTLQPVLLETTTLVGNQTKQFSFFLESGTHARVDALSSSENYSIRLTSPSGNIYDVNSNVYQSNNSDFGIGKSFLLDSPQEGIWQLEVSSTTGLEVTVGASMQTAKRLSTKVTPKQVKVGSNYLIKTAFTDAGEPITGATLLATILEGNNIVTLALKDDGSNGDAKANDGIYSSIVPAGTTPGLFRVDIKATKAKLTLVGQEDVTIFTETAILTGNYQEKVEDTNADNLYDQLMIEVEVNVKEQTHFTIMGELVDAKDNIIAYASYNTYEQVLPANGIYALPLIFEGETIAAHGIDGPYQLKNVTIIDNTSSVQVDQATNDYETEAYSTSDFQRDNFLLKQDLSGETPVDTGNDGKYDYLDIKLAFDVALPGNYNFSGQLVDSLGNSIQWTEGTVNLIKGINQVILRFSGSEINSKSTNGPYILTDLSFYATNIIASASFRDIYKTAAYPYDDFAGLAISGYILASTSQLPIVGAEVVLGGSAIAVTSSDSSGFFRFGGLTIGTYTVLAKKEGYCNSEILVRSVPTQTQASFTLHPGQYQDKGYISLVDSLIDFNPTKVGTVVKKELIVSNVGCDTLVLNELQVISTVFSIISTQSKIAPADSAIFTIQFKPNAEKAFSDTLKIYSNSNNVTVILTGTGVSSGSDKEVVTGFTLVNADTDEDILELNDYDTLNLAAFASLNLNIRANTNPDTVGSVLFDLNGKKAIENNMPYAYAGNSGSNYYAFTPRRGNHVLTATPYAAKGGEGDAGTALTVRFHVIYQAVTKFTLIDADTDKPIQDLKEGDTINVSQLPSQHLNIRATTNPATVGSVIFNLSGKRAIERINPYAYAANKGADYFAFTLPVGQHVLTATPYSKRIASNDTADGGFRGKPLTIKFNVTGLAVNDLVLLDADTDKDIRVLSSRDTIDLSSLPTWRLNVRAVTNPDTVGSVTFKLNSQPVVRENYFPYAIGGDTNGDFSSWMLPTGTHTLTATPYIDKNAAGGQGAAHTVAFSVVNSGGAARMGSPASSATGQGLQAAPNPFSDRTTLTFSVPESGFTNLEILNSHGLRVASLFNAYAESGKTCSVTFAGQRLPSGMYLAKLITNQKVSYYKLVLVK